jgi:pimeloyl-ACP methyl ester carboxylesterase
MPINIGQPERKRTMAKEIWRRGSQSIPIERPRIFDLPRPKPTVRATARKWNSAFDKSLSAPDDPSSTTLRRELASRIRGTEYIILSGVGHLSPLEAPSELAIAIMKAVSHMR